MAWLSLLLGLSTSCLAPAWAGSRFGFDCESGYKHWRQAWPVEKRKWCCAYVQRGCNGDNRHRDIFDCGDSLTTWRKAWSNEKKSWCCENKQPWSISHQNFCCELGKGCQRGPQGPPFNCRTGAWTDAKRKWCCTNDAPHGCVATTTKMFDCHAGLANANTGWSKRKQSWCCQKEDLGCPMQVPDRGRGPGDGMPPINGIGNGGKYHCAVGFQAKSNWHKDKVCYCCNHFGIACPPVYYPPNIPPADVVVCNGEIAAFDGSIPEVAPRSKFPHAGLLVAASVLGFMALIAVVTGVRRRFINGHDHLKASASEQSKPLTQLDEDRSETGDVELEMEVY